MAGLKYTGDVVLNAALTVTLAKPLDVRTVIAFADDRFQINSQSAYEGMAVACVDNGNIYILVDKNNIDNANGWKASYESIQIKVCTKTEYQEWSDNTTENFRPIDSSLPYLSAETYYYIIQEDSDTPGDYYVSAQLLLDLQALVNTKASSDSVSILSANLTATIESLVNYALVDDVENTYVPKTDLDLTNPESFLSSTLNDYVTKDLLTGGDGEDFIFVTKRVYDENLTLIWEDLNRSLKTNSKGELETITVGQIISPQIEGEEQLIVDVTKDGLYIGEDPIAKVSEIPKIQVLSQEDFDTLVEEGATLEDVYYYTYDGDPDFIYVLKRDLESQYSTTATIANKYYNKTLLDTIIDGLQVSGDYTTTQWIVDNYFNKEESNSLYLTKVEAESTYETLENIQSTLQDYVTKLDLRGDAAEGEDDFMFVLLREYDADKQSALENIDTANISLILEENSVVLSASLDKLLVNNKLAALLEEVPKIEVLTQEEYDVKVEELTTEEDTYYYTYDGESRLVTKSEADSSYASLSSVSSLTNRLSNNYYNKEDITTLVSGLAGADTAVDVTNIKSDIRSILDRLTNLENLEEYTYEELTLLVNSNSLISGLLYILSDYLCIYLDAFDFTTVYTEEQDGWKLILTAVSANDFSHNVTIFYASDSIYAQNGGIPIIECKYRFSPASAPNMIFNWEPESSKGSIYYLKDFNHNICQYDFKHMKFKRYGVSDIKPNLSKENSAEDTYGCYRCCITGKVHSGPDDRAFLGGGAQMEYGLADGDGSDGLISHIFNGTFRKSIWWDWAGGTDSNEKYLYDYSENYINTTHKPYKSDINKSFLRFWPNGTLSADLPTTWYSYTNGPVVNLAIYEETDDSLMFYTFDYFDGESHHDYSNNMLCVDNFLESRIAGNNDEVKLCIPNTVFQTFGGSLNAQIYSNRLRGCKNNTILMLPYESTRTTPRFAQIETNSFLGNIIISVYQFRNKFNVLEYNLFLNVQYYKGVSTLSVEKSILIGAFLSHDMKECRSNILFGDPGKMRLENDDTTWVSNNGNAYWYDNKIEHWFGYNIMGPFMYASFAPHTNTNTVVMPYNKGVIFKGTILGNFFKRLCWGTELGYGSCLGTHWKGALYEVVFRPMAFSANYSYLDGDNNTYKVNEADKLPKMLNVHVNTYYVNQHDFIENITEEQKTSLVSSGEPVLLAVNSAKEIKIAKFSDLIL